MHVVISQFEIANDKLAEVRDAFMNRPHRVDTVPGFVRMEVLSPLEQPAEIWLVTYWRDEQSYQDWHRSHAYHDAHQAIPAGLKLVPQNTRIRSFELFAE
jgi:heme-degrading monooxygenase HmoA